MYAKIENNVAVKWPYSKDNLRKDNPQTSFPAELSEAVLAAYGVVDVFITNAPEVDYTKNLTQKPPVFNADKNRWETSWEVTNASDDEIQQRTEQQENKVRAERNASLSGSDWTQVADAPVDKAAWSIYRQALRDVTTQAGFPWAVQWPEKP